MSEINGLQTKLTDPSPEQVETPQALVPAGPVQHKSLEMVIPQGTRLAFWANWDTSDWAGKALVSKCFGEADLKIDKVIGQTIWLTRLLVHPVQLVSPEDGEIQDATRCVLVLKDGQTVAAVSTGILKSVQLVTMLCGQGPWEQGIPVVVRQISTRAGRRTYEIQLDALAMGQGTEGGKKRASGK